MITVEFVTTMSRYNAWQNSSIYEAASKLNDEARNMDRQAFFGSIHETLSHLLWGDQIWMSRFAGTPQPLAKSIDDSRCMVAEWVDLKAQRMEFDKTILSWSETVTEDFLSGNMSWFSGAIKKTVTRPTGMLVAHMFNHQTHHRGQVNTMLLQAGCKLDDTDLFVLPETA